MREARFVGDRWRVSRATRWDGRPACVSAAIVVLVTLGLVVGCSRKAAVEDAGAPSASPPASASAAASPSASASAWSTSLASAPPSAEADVVSSASAGEMPVEASGEVDGAALRASARARIAADRSPVTMLRETDGPRDLGRRLCETVVPARPKETPVLVKPNLGGFEWFRDPKKTGGDDGLRGRITDPEFVRGIVRCLKARGHTKVTLAEGWGATHADWKRLVKLSGYEAMAREEGVPLVAMDDDGVFDVEGTQPGKPLRVLGMEKTHAPTLLMPKVLAEHLRGGLFISAPKIKAHRFSVVSMAIKGGQGVVMLSDAAPAYRQKWRMHKEIDGALGLLGSDVAAGKRAYVEALEIFAERMTDVLEVAAPHVVLAEGAPAVGGDGFGKQWASPDRFAIGGTNPILVDRVGAAMLGLWDRDDLAAELGGHRTSPLIETAAKRFGVDVTSPVVEGDGAALLAAPRPSHFVSMTKFAIHSEDRPASIVPPRAGDPAGDAGTDPERVLRAPRASGEGVVIDGEIDAAWAAATPVTFDTDWSGKKTGIVTKARAMWSPRALHVLWELEGAGVNADASRPIETERERLYEEDCVEIFVGVSESAPWRYYELEVGPLGHFLDVAVDRVLKKSDVGWSARAKIATKVDRAARRVTIETAIEAPEITSALTPGARLPLALYRMEGKRTAETARSYLAWSPTRTPKPDFHVPEAFGTLVLE